MNFEALPKTCQVCGSELPPPLTLTCRAYGPYFGNVVTFLECASCGFISAPNNTHEYATEADFHGIEMPDVNSGRVGSRLRPGREYFMASMANDIMERSELKAGSVLFYGAGMSLDHRRISDEFPNKVVKVCDLSNFQETENFISTDSQEKFDVVIACEVVEHFTDVKENFSKLLSKCSENGMVVLSTNISDESSLSSLEYPFREGHTAYYSGRSLILLMKQIDPAYKVDFRAPRASIAQLGSRKRYILIYRDVGIELGISDYFSRHLMAPSEAISRPSLSTKIRRSLFRFVHRR
jgi:hypothetical protein